MLGMFPSHVREFEVEPEPELKPAVMEKARRAMIWEGGREGDVREC